MRKDVNKTLVGGFVVGALFLVVAGVILFGSGDFFKRKVGYVLYFDSSVKGLNVGSPVVFRGVKVGSVTGIALIADAQDFSFEIPVTIEVEPASFQIKRGRIGGDGRQSIDKLIAHGLRAQLQSQSILTGQLMVELDFYTDKPAILRGQPGDLPEIPTIPSTLESLVQAIKDLNLDETTRNLSRLVAGIENMVNSPQIGATITSLQQAIEAANGLITTADRRLGPLLDNIEHTVQTAETLLGRLDGQVTPLAADLTATARAAARTMDQAEQTLAGVQGALGEDSALLYQLQTTLGDLSVAAGSIRAWAEYMERHPESLLRGKK
jgi:paraquat-inducible protein B